MQFSHSFAEMVLQDAYLQNEGCKRPKCTNERQDWLIVRHPEYTLWHHNPPYDVLQRLPYLCREIGPHLCNLVTALQKWFCNTRIYKMKAAKDQSVLTRDKIG
ncbi:hypothetical protein CDAR_228031 [Caerostris darwini]|uniref:Uncharacterized protein n=1 Tax=Caerostris darwini TaxID=1538125 RepID=A0AAV4VDW8_9ARAC|nr:hypothetical protein CDAR_228031 [Caerostris darwini]